MTEILQGQTWYVFSERVALYRLNKDPDAHIGTYLIRPACFLVIDTNYHIGHGTLDHWVRVLHKGDYYIIDATNFFGGPILEADVFARFAPDELL